MLINATSSLLQKSLLFQTFKTYSIFEEKRVDLFILFSDQRYIL